MKSRWVEPDLRDAIVDFVKAYTARTEQPVQPTLKRLDIAPAQFYRWQSRYGQVLTPHGPTPREHWLTPDERTRILQYHAQHPLEGYRRLTYMMLDADMVAVSPASVYRVLKQAGVLDRWTRTPSRKGTGFEQPLASHEHWHIDVSHLNICGTFYYLCSVIDGATRYIVHWEIRAAMKESDVELILQKALEKFPEARPRIISDNGPQFVAKDFKEFIRMAQLTHVRTSPHYPQSNGKKERWFQTLKREAIRPKTPLDLEQARAVVAEFVQHYNEVRLHSALGYITPKDKLEGREKQIWKDRDAKLEAARERRKQKRREQVALSA